MAELKYCLVLCMAVLCITLLAFAGMAPEEPVAPPAPESIELTEYQASVVAVLGGLMLAGLGLWLFRAFTPQERPYMVEYVSPKLDPEDLRNL